MTYFLVEIALCSVVVVAVGTILFLVSVSLVALAKGAVMLARLMCRLSLEIANTVSLSTWRSTERVRTSG